MFDNSRSWTPLCLPSLSRCILGRMTKVGFPIRVYRNPRTEGVLGYYDTVTPCTLLGLLHVTCASCGIVALLLYVCVCKTPPTNHRNGQFAPIVGGGAQEVEATVTREGNKTKMLLAEWSNNNICPRAGFRSRVLFVVNAVTDDF